MPEKPPPPGAAFDAGETTVTRPGGMPLPQEALPGPLFARRYALLRMLGRGGMGTVYQARDNLVGDVVALKTLELGKDAGPDAIERFSREVRLARRITHPHVARIHDLGTHEGQSFLTMEFVEGEDVRTLLARERPLTAPRAARIALAVSEGLAAAHAAGVVHRDLKPANILVEKGGRVVLTDFGIARAVAGEAASRTQGTVGTPLYMAPEQVSGDAVDARADLYAVGLLLYELLTGQAPFSGESPWATALARLRQPPPDPRSRANVPDPLAGLVLRCLARTPEERPASALDVAGALRDWLVSVGEATLSGPPTQEPVLENAPLPPPASASRLTPRTATTPAVEQGVAVLPLYYQGPRESEYLGDSLTEALIDQLSRVRGLRVPGRGVMARFRDERDPRTVQRELGVESVLDGTVQCASSQVRVSVRLLEARSGTQLWSGRFEYGSTQAFELQDWLVPRIAEEVRGELTLATWRASTSPEALALYRQAAAHVHEPFWNGPDSPLNLLESCLELAPDFQPAISLHAVASLRAWFVALRDEGLDWAASARASVERALRLAPDLPPTHLARAMLAAQQGDWRAAVIALRTALDIAPSHAASLQYLGMLQCESGHADEGLPRLRLVCELTPSHMVALFELARCSALRGKMDDYRWAMERLSASAHYRRFGAISLRVRVSSWMRDLEELRRCRAALMDEPELLTRLGRHYADVVLGEVDALSLGEELERILAQVSSPRFVSLLCQLATEMMCLSGHTEQSMTYFQRAADTALVDLEWIDRCPALKPLRALPGFDKERRKVLARVEAIWNA